jgi:DNA-binding MarR family transcriptional regulator
MCRKPFESCTVVADLVRVGVETGVVATILPCQPTMPDQFAQYAALATFHNKLERLVAATDQCTREAGLRRTKFRLLMAIKRQPTDAPATIGTLAHSMSLDRGAIVQLLEQLVHQGFVQRERDPNDRRRILISLTSEGDAWLAPLIDAALRELAASGPELLQALRVALAHAVAHVAHPRPLTRPDVGDFAWRGVGVAAI